MTSQTKILKFIGVYEYDAKKSVADAVRYLVGCGIHNIEIIDSFKENETE